MAEPKLVWNPDNVRDVAESVGISALGDEAVRALSQEVEYRVGQVIVEAMRFMHQGKRTVLGTQDISQALKVLDVEPLYGYESTRPLRFGEASLGPGQPLFYIEDEEVDFEKLINAPLPKVPRDISFTGMGISRWGIHLANILQRIGSPLKAFNHRYHKIPQQQKHEQTI
jgi:transcription initiation factor TFIID subunit 6